MVAHEINCDAMTLQGKLKVIRKVEANPTVTCIQLAKEL
jgi:hypothetical protein